MYALSTAWNADRCRDGKTIVEEIYRLGINTIELNFSLTQKTVEEIRRFARQKNIRIASLHNFCPIPDELEPQVALPDYFSLSSLNEDERKKAVEYTKVTISTAKRVSAKIVILHCGRVEIEDKTKRLLDLARDGQLQSHLFREISENAKKERKLKSPNHIAQITKSLKELCVYAEKYDVTLGIENRFYFREIPSVDELGFIFDRYKRSAIAYWHDVGHGYILEKLGFAKEGALLERYGSRLCGVHLHNIKNLRDHQAPAEGDFDFSVLRTCIRPQTLKVIEVHGHVCAEMIKKSITYLKGVLGG